MKRSYLLPRLLLALIALGIILWRVDRLAQKTLVETGEAFVGSKVDVGQVHTSLSRLTLTLHGVAAAHPTAGDKNLVECDEAVFHLDRAAALRRRFVVRDGRVSGLKFNTPRAAAGPAIELESNLPAATVPAIQLGGLEQLAGQDAGSPRADLTSISMAQGLAEKWSKSWKGLETAAEALSKRAAELGHEVELARRYPLKAQDKWRLVATESEQVATELEAVQAQLAKLREQAAADQVTLTDAWKADQQKLQVGSPAGQFDPDQLTTLMLGRENAARVERTLACVHWLRQQASAPRIATNQLLRRGQRGPDFLIESIALSGETEFAGRMVAWEGTASGLTTDPKAYGRPAVLRLLAGEPYPMTLEGIFDHTGDIPKDRVAIDCPVTPLAERTLGEPRQIAIDVAPSNAQIRVVVEITGDRLTGEIVCKQDRTLLTVASVAPELASSRDLVQSAASNIGRMETRAELSGSLQRPVWKLRSDLGLQLANGLRDVLQRKLDADRDAAFQEARQQLAVEVEKLDRWLLEEEQCITSAVSSAKTIVEELQVQVAERKNRLNNSDQTLRR